MHSSLARSHVFVKLILLASFAVQTPAAASDLGSVQLRFKQSEQEMLEPIITDVVKTVRNFYRDTYKIKITRPVVLITSQDPEFLARARYEANGKKFRLSKLQDFARKRCRFANQVTGAADVRTIRICLKSALPITKQWLEFHKVKITRVILHELMHTIQRQLSGSNYYKLGRRPRHGPKWLVEGSAMYAENQFLISIGKRPLSLRRIMSWARKSPQPLAKISEGGKLLPGQAYGLAALSSYILIRKFGQTRMIAYWKALKSNHSWETAFKNTYGVSLPEFMQKVEDIRNSESAIRSIIVER